jgi:DNA-binding CsgD family transcriptional regulator
MLGTVASSGAFMSTNTVFSEVQLTPRELEIVQLLAGGKTNREVGASLGISTKTAEAHRANVMRKLALHSVAELVRYAIKKQIVEP